LDYFEHVNTFYKDLKKMCEKLKEFPRDGQNGRNKILKNFIYSFNMTMINKRKEYLDNNES
jgi:hypothetical protein